jgi:hypothetical protein
MDNKVAAPEAVHWIKATQDGVQLHALMNMLMNIQVP